MRAAVQVSKTETFHWGVSTSLLFHVLLILAVLLSPVAPKLMRAPPDPSVAVEILTQQQFQAAVESGPTTAPAPAAPAPVAPESVAVPPAASPPEPKAASGMIVARTMLSGKTLADPRSSGARKELATFADSERVVQLCNLEAMDQVGAWRSSFQPDRLVAYARSDIKMNGETMVADGAAFRSRNRWYEIRFKCEVAPDHVRVVAFEFQVGDPVPSKDWEELGLPAVH